VPNRPKKNRRYSNEAELKVIMAKTRLPNLSTRHCKRVRDMIRRRDGNGYPKPETRWVFTLLGYGFGSIFIPMGLLMGINLYPAGLWVRVCSYSTQTREPVGF
jgi:hypothetical protein